MAPELLDILSRAGQAYAPVSEPPPGAPSADGVASASVDASSDSCAVEGVERSAEESGLDGEDEALARFAGRMARKVGALAERIEGKLA